MDLSNSTESRGTSNSIYFIISPRPKWEINYCRGAGSGFIELFSLYACYCFIFHIHTYNELIQGKGWPSTCYNHEKLAVKDFFRNHYFWECLFPDPLLLSVVSPTDCYIATILFWILVTGLLYFLAIFFDLWSYPEEYFSWVYRVVIWYPQQH